MDNTKSIEENNIKERNLEKIIRYFKAGEKCDGYMKAGVEIEHFVLDDRGNSMHYEELVRMMEEMRTQEDTPYYEEGHLLGFYNDDYSVTLEPAAQLEISIAPKRTIKEIENIYLEFQKKTEDFLKSRDFHLVNRGYHPFMKAEELELIPKKRYEYMNQYFEKTGTMGKNMMRATASVQVSLDYTDEADFVEKYRLACILSPIFALITDNSPVFEGKKTEKRMVRTVIWKHTDPVRCGIFPQTFNQDFGYRAYAEYLYEHPPILVIDGEGHAIFTGDKKACEIYRDREMTEKEVEHLLSMYFPDVRLKNYIELRAGDSMELPFALAYTALVKTVFYTDGIRKELCSFFGNVSREDIAAAKSTLIDHGSQGMAYGRRAAEIIEKLISEVKKYPTEENKHYMGCLLTKMEEYVMQKSEAVQQNEKEQQSVSVQQKAEVQQSKSVQYDKEMAQGNGQDDTMKYRGKLAEINKEYMKGIKEDREEDFASAGRALSYIQNSTAKYHGRCVRTLYIPKIFTEWDIKLFEKAITELYGIFDKVIKHYYEDEAYRKLFGFEKELEELILREVKYKTNIPVARIDIFYNEDTGDFKFCEFNTDGTSAMNEDRELNKAIRLTSAYEIFAAKYEISTFELFDSWVEEFLKIYGEFAENTGKKKTPNVAIVDFMENATEQEFKIFKERFEAKGIRAEICEIRELTYSDNKLYSKDGMEIDAIYRRAVTSDIMKHYSEVGAFLQAVKEEAACLIGEFRTQIVHNKILFKLLHDEKTQAFLTEEEKEYVKKHVPLTVNLEAGKFDYQEVIKNKDQWIIKPEDSYGSQGVYAGVEYGQDAWKEKVDGAMGKHYLLQEFCRPFETPNVDLMKSRDAEIANYSNLTGMFVYDGKFRGIYSRISRSEIISTQYSEMALPTIVVK